MKKMSIKKDDLNKVITLGALLEYTDEFLLPKISEVINDSINKNVPPMIAKGNADLKYELKDYIDKKMDYYTTDIFKRLDKKYQKEKQFKEKVVELFKKHNIGSPTDLAFLEGLVSGS